MKINHPNLIGAESLDLDFSIGDLVKRNDGRFDEEEFVISSINVKPDTGIIYQGIFYIKNEEEERREPVIAHGDKNNLDLVQKNYYEKVIKHKE
ncbi:MAG: hypothetical protein ACQEQD_04600 [Bacillota bacterium]